jgi:two-component system, LytTR family, sensor kinase
MFKHRWLYWLWLVALCLLLGLVDALRSYGSAYNNGIYNLAWRAALRWDLSGWLIWAPLIPLVLRIANRLPINRENWPGRLLFYAALGLLLSLLRTVFPILVYLVFVANLASFKHLLARKPYFLLTDFLFALVFYSCVLAFGQARNYYRRYREEELHNSQLEAQLARAELRALKMQLHPHFLFNTLHSISSLQLEDVAAAQKMTARLGDFLRLTLENAGVQEVPLRRELEFLKCYLEIEQVRFGRRLTTAIEVEPEALETLVPNLLLQPLVENAIRHGIAPRPAPGYISVSAKRERDRLKVIISDNGCGLPPQGASLVKEGLGLQNTRARLQQLYGADFGFALENAAAGGLVVTLNLPLATNGHGAETANGERPK